MLSGGYGRPIGSGFFMPMRNRILPGRHITDCQMRLYMSLRQAETPTVAAAKAGFSAATAYRIEVGPPAALAKASTTRALAAGSAGRSLGQRGGALAEEHPRPAASRHF